MSSNTDIGAAGGSGGALSESLPPNNAARMAQADNDPSTTSNPVKMGSGAVSQGTSSIGKEGTEELSQGTKSEVSAGDAGAEEKKGMGDKIKEKLKG